MKRSLGYIFWRTGNSGQENHQNNSPTNRSSILLRSLTWIARFRIPGRITRMSHWSKLLGSLLFNYVKLQAIENSIYEISQLILHAYIRIQSLHLLLTKLIRYLRKITKFDLDMLTYITYLKSSQKQFPENKKLSIAKFDESILDCKVYKIAKFNKLPFPKIRQRATFPLQMIDTGTMAKISPLTFPKSYKYISVFVDDFSRLRMAYPMKSKDETGYSLEAFVKSARNLLGIQIWTRFVICVQIRG